MRYNASDEYPADNEYVLLVLPAIGSASEVHISEDAWNVETLAEIQRTHPNCGVYLKSTPRKPRVNTARVWKMA